MEILDVVDEQGIPTGVTVERTKAHEEGIRHRTSHVWVLREKEGKVQILLQRRSADKDSNPLCYDCSSAGHIPAGVDFVPSAIRELKEELGIDVKKEELTYCGTKRINHTNTFHGKIFKDNQVSRVYCMYRDIEEKDFIIQKEELESVKWFDFEEIIQLVRENKIDNCIDMQELEMVKTQIHGKQNH